MRTATSRIVSVILLVTAVSGARAASFAVDSTADAVDTIPGDGTCDDGTGACPLRAAIQEANALAGADEITVPAGTYTLAIAPGTEASTAHDDAVGDLDVTENLTITGAGSGTTEVNGANLSRVFHVAAAQTVTLSGLTIRDGADQFGGGVFAEGNVTLSDVVVTENVAGDGGGAGIRGAGALTLSACTVSNNHGGTGQGGGIFGGSPLLVAQSTISGNTTADQGGGIFTDGPLILTDSTISGNSSMDQGGGIFIENGPLTIVNSTISGNSAADSGGGIFNNPPIGSANAVHIINTTITANNAPSGGGLATFDPGIIGLRNTLVAGNSDQDGSAPDLGGSVSSEGFNLIGSTNGANVTGDTTGNVVGQSADLGPLADNGGPTQTHGLLPGSPAIDAGDPAGCTDADGAPLTTDQRGQPRPQGPRCDIGAFEGVLSGTATTTTTTMTTTTTLPVGCAGVPDAATFTSIACRLQALAADTDATEELGDLRAKLAVPLRKALDRTQVAADACAQPRRKKAKSRLKQVVRQCIHYSHRLRSRSARRKFAEEVREPLAQRADTIQTDVRTLRGALVCPDDAPL